MKPWLWRWVAVSALGWLVAGPTGLAVAPALLAFHAAAPSIAQVVAPLALAAMVVVVVAESDLDVPTRRFVDDRPVAHAVGLLVVVAVAVAIISRAPSTSRVAPPSLVTEPLERSITPITERRRGATIATGAAVVVASLLAVVAVDGPVSPATAGAAGLASLLGGYGVAGAIRASRDRLAARPRSAADGVVRGSMWLLAATAIVSAGSFVFWVVASHRLGSGAVGRGSALFAIAFLLTYLTGLGLPVAVTRFGGEPTVASAGVFAWATVATTWSSLVGAAAFVAVAPARIVGPIGGRSPAALTVMFVVVAMISISILVDARLTALGRWSTVFWRTTAIAVVRLLAFPLIPMDDDGRWVFLVSAGAYGITALPVLPSVLRVDGRWARLRPLVAVRELVRYAGVNYAGQLAVQAPFYVTPVVILLQVSSDDNAAFYVAWGVTAVVIVGVQVVAQALLAAGKGEVVADRRSAVAGAMGVALLLTGLAAIVALVAAPAVRALFGDGFDDVTTHLRLLVPGCIPWSITMLSLTDARLRADGRTTILISVVYAVCGVATVLAGVMIGGAIGGSAGWLVGNVVAGAIALPTLLRALARDRAPSPS